jgi:hypothetical protein
MHDFEITHFFSSWYSNLCYELAKLYSKGKNDDRKTLYSTIIRGNNTSGFLFTS